MTIDYEVGHIVGIAAVMLYVIVKSVLWYAIPPILKNVDDTIRAVRKESKAFRPINLTAMGISFAGLGVAAYMLDFNTVTIYGLILVILMVIMYIHEQTLFVESTRNVGFEGPLEAIEFYTEQQEAKKKDDTKAAASKTQEGTKDDTQQSEDSDAK